MRNEVTAGEIVKVGPHGRFEKVHLEEPSGHGYLLLAAEVDHRLPFAYFLESKGKKALLEKLKHACAELLATGGVLEAVTFKTLLIPPGRGEYLQKRPELKPARYDVAVLIECENEDHALGLKENPLVKAMIAAMQEAATRVLTLAASNARKIGAVDHSRDGVFLLNFFVADDVRKNLGIWEYTAGWFQQETGLDNSTVLLPAEGEKTDSTIINHCRWDRLTDIIPSLVFKPSFRSYVLDNFAANATGATPILYRLA